MVKTKQKQWMIHKFSLLLRYSPIKHNLHIRRYMTCKLDREIYDIYKEYIKDEQTLKKLN